jgi:flagellar motor switch protein FliN/FliY
MKMSSIHKLALSLTEQWTEEFIKVTAAMADAQPVMAISQTEPDREGMLWWKQPFDAAPGALLWAGAPADTWNSMGSLVLAAAGVDTPSADELKDTYLEVLRQSLGGVASRIGAALGCEVACTEGAEEAPASGALLSVSISVNGQALAPMAFGVSSELIAILESAGQAAASAAEADPVPAPYPAHPASTSAEGATEDLPLQAAGTLDLLMDVEMPVRISFGRTQVPVREVLKLSTGSIVELDRAISEPVDVIVNNCILARGEVVVVEGNYGVRITEVMSRRERLQHSRKYMLPLSSRRK